MNNREQNVSDVRERLIIGLDVPDLYQARLLVKELGEAACFYKIGHQLAFTGGMELARELIAGGKKVFLDAKLLDIDHTITKAVENIVGLGVSMLTIHAYPKAMKAAVEAAKGSSLCLLGVTVLTSMDKIDLVQAGYAALDRNELVLLRAKQSLEIGMGGVVCSAQEAKDVRNILGEDAIIVTPGIRPYGYAGDDHISTVTPVQALERGSSHIVISRPIFQNQDKRNFINQIISDMRDYLKKSNL